MAEIDFKFLQTALEVFDFRLTAEGNSGYEIVTLRPPRLSRRFATLYEAQAFFDGVFFFSKMRAEESDEIVA